MIKKIDGIIERVRNINGENPPKSPLGQIFGKFTSTDEPYMLKIQQGDEKLTALFWGEKPQVNSRIIGTGHVAEGLPNDNRSKIELGREVQIFEPEVQ